MRSYILLLTGIVNKSAVELQYKVRGEARWGFALSFYDTWSMLHIYVDDSSTRWITHRDVISYRHDGAEELWPRHKNDGQTKLF